MPTTIENFFTRAAQKQFSRDILFRVKQINIAGLQMNGEDDLIYARSAALPGRDIENKNVRYSGQNFNVPGVSNYPGSDSWSIDFYHDQNIEIRTKLEKASRLLFNNETTTGQICMPGPESYILLGDRSLLHVERTGDIHHTGVALLLDQLVDAFEIIFSGLTGRGRRHVFASINHTPPRAGKRRPPELLH